jgi:hypothetical protein
METRLAGYLTAFLGLIAGAPACLPPQAAAPDPQVALPRYSGLPPVANVGMSAAYRFAFIDENGDQTFLALYASDTLASLQHTYHRLGSARWVTYFPASVGPLDVEELRSRLQAVGFWAMPQGLAGLPASGGSIVEAFESPSLYHAVLTPGRTAGGLHYACSYLTFLAFPC